MEPRPHCFEHAATKYQYGVIKNPDDPEAVQVHEHADDGGLEWARSCVSTAQAAGIDYRLAVREVTAWGVLTVEHLHSETYRVCECCDPGVCDKGVDRCMGCGQPAPCPTLLTTPAGKGLPS